jgi:apolipoprotein D and lipocalin family protein
VVRFRLALCSLLASFGLACSGDEPAVARNLELSRFQGRWYEIARIPRDHDRLCHDTLADYRLTGPSELELVHQCHVGSATGPLSQFRAPAIAEDPAVPAKLSLKIGLFYGAYWVLEVGKDYDYAVIGHPSLTLLWVLSRKPTLERATWDHVLDLVTRQGFGTNLLEPTPQSAARTE